MELENLKLRFGPLADSLVSQLEGQGYHLPASLPYYQRAANNVTWLYLHEYLTHRQAMALRRKIHKRLTKIIKKKAKATR